MRDVFVRYSPPGYEPRAERTLIVMSMLAAFLYSAFRFFAAFFIAKSDLYEPVGGQLTLREYAYMPDFRELLGNGMVGFAVTAVIIVGFIVFRYAYFRQGSRSIYLMKRLPNRAELHKRALALPLLALAVCLAAAFLLLLLYFAFYMVATPKACLRPDQWQILWRWS